MERKLQFHFTLPQAILVVLYLLYVIGIFWSSNERAAMFALEVKLSLVVFPIMIGLDRAFFKENITGILLFFVAGIIASSLICLSTAIWESSFFLPNGFSFNTIDPKFAEWSYGGSRFRYLGLSRFLHPTYYSFYVLFALVVTLVLLKRRIFSNKYLLLWLKMSIPLFILMIYLLSSKAVLISALIIFIVFSGIIYRRYNNKFIKFFILFLSLVFIIVALKNPRFEEIVKAVNNPELLTDNSRDGSFISRIHIWKAGVDIIEDNFLYGVGPGDTNDELLIRYKNYKYKDPLLKKSNAHNQYIETFIDLGLIGFFVLLSALFVPFFSYERRNILFRFFLFIIGFNFLFESILNTQAGLVFFGFFYSLLSIVDEDDIRKLSA